MEKKYLSLQQSEGLVFQAAASIYAAYLSAGKVADSEERAWMKRAIREAILIAEATDDAIVSDDERPIL